MNTFRYVMLVCIMLTVGVEATAAGKTPGARRLSAQRKYIPGEIIVKFKSDVGRVETSNKAQRVLASRGVFSASPAFPRKSADPSFQSHPSGLARVYVLRVASPTDVPQLAAEIALDPSVEYAEPNYVFKADTVVPNDPRYPQEHHLPQVDATIAWDIETGDSSIVIAIIDTGVDWDHPDLASHIWSNDDEIPDNSIDDDGNGYVDDIRGWDFVEGLDTADVWPGEDFLVPDNNPMDYNGHGTHCSGIASAATNNATGVASLMWNARIMPLRIGYHAADGNGLGSSLWMAEAFMYAADNGADIASLSFGHGQVAVDGARYAYDLGVVICNSAGNSDAIDIGLIGQEGWAFGVAAVQANDLKASYSSYHPDVDVSAPGGDINTGGELAGFLSTVPTPSPFYSGGYAFFQGTSMSTPYVASLAALVKSQHPTWTPAQIMFQIVGTADNIDGLNPSYAGMLGSGRINAYRALTETPPAALPKFKIKSFSVRDSIGGNNDGKLTAGETGTIYLTFENVWGDASSVEATFTANSSALQITNGNWNIGSLPGISDITNSTVSNTVIPFSFDVSDSAFPMIIPCEVTITAAGGYSIVEQFDISLYPSVLFVDDDDGQVNVESYFTNAFKALNIPHTVWDRSTRGTPSAALMANFSTVIWGCEWAFPSLNGTDRAELGTYLDNGGRVFLSGQDVGWDLNDPTTAATNEYDASGGASKTWFENYFKAQYISDDQSGGALSTQVTGVTGDSIGNGLSFLISEPLRGVDNQYPDVIAPIAGASSSFRYNDNTSGAVRHASGKRTVFFGFGGYESISDSATRIQVLQRVMSYLNLSSLSFTTFNDVEDTISSYLVDANVSVGLDSILSVDMYWDADGAFPFNKISMFDSGNGNYSGVIPSVGNSADISYTVVVNTTGGYLPAPIKSFRAGLDFTPPTASLVDSLKNTIRQTGPYSITVSAADNLAMNPTGCVIHFNVNGGPDSSVVIPLESMMAYQMKGSRARRPMASGTYSGTFALATPASSGSTLNYYVTVTDGATAQNEVRIPSAGYKSVAIGREIIDDFESVKPQWSYGTSWARSTESKYLGLYGMNDSPGGSPYQPNTNNALTLTPGIDLSNYGAAKLYFYRRYLFAPGDTCFVERSIDGVHWTTLKKFFGLTQASPFRLDSLGLMTGPGTDQQQFRFRVTSNATQQSDGIYIDELEVKTDSYLPASAAFQASQTQFSFDSVFMPNQDVDTIFVRNLGSQTLTISSAISTDQNFLVSPISGSIAPGDSQQFFITFKPVQLGQRSGQIIFTHNGVSSIDALIAQGIGASNNAFIQPGYDDGWNLVSLPAEPDSAIQLPMLYAFNGKYEARNSMEMGTGYWAKPDTDYTHSGLPVFRDTFALSPKWNLIGSITGPVPTASIVTIPGGILTSSFYAFIDTGYEVADTIEPGRGYWVKSSASGSIILDQLSSIPVAATVTSAGALKSQFEDAHLLTVQNSSGRIRKLYFKASNSKETGEATTQELPPVPPAGVFDVRFTSNRLIEMHPEKLTSSVEYRIALQSDEAITIRWDITAPAAQYSLQWTNSQGKKETRAVKGRGEVRIANPQEANLRLVASPIAVPTVYALRQNYPNPFNPTTLIAYDLPEAGAVRLIVYDILGQEVQTLVDEVQEAGFYNVPFNADGVASGIYFYKLTAGSFTSIRKMMLLR